MAKNKAYITQQVLDLESHTRQNRHMLRKLNKFYKQLDKLNKKG